MKEKQRFKFSNKMKVGLALGGGGARGFAHIGAIRAFEEHGITFEYISGTSAGAIVGAMYSAGLKSEDMIEKSISFNMKDIKTSVIPFMPNKTEAFQNVFKEIIGDKQFSDLKIPFTAVAADIKTGTEVYLNSGSVVEAVSASCAVPGIFYPVEIGEYRLFDGGILNNIPSKVAKDNGCDIVISVDVHSKRGGGTESEKYLDMIFSSISIMMKNSSLKGYLHSDLVIKPDTKRFSATKIINKNEMIEEGYNATISKMPEIKELLKIKDKGEGFFVRWKNRSKKVKIDSDGEIDVEVDIDSDKADKTIIKDDETESKRLEKNIEKLQKNKHKKAPDNKQKTKKHKKNTKKQLNIKEYEFLD